MPSPQYPIPWKLLQKLAPAILFGSKLDFEQQSRLAMEYLPTPVQVLGKENIPTGGPGMILVNHYSAPGFMAWWFVLAISSITPVHVHWITTSAWMFQDQPLLKPLEPLSYWIFTRMARAYGFSTMPPMPPQVNHVEKRAQAIRQVMRQVKNNPRILLGTAPEGQDFPGARLGTPPPGAGRFLLHLAQQGIPFYPVGYYDSGGVPCLSFGPCFRLSLPEDLPNGEADQMASSIVMAAIARQLPEELRGNFAI